MSLCVRTLAILIHRADDPRWLCEQLERDILGVSGIFHVDFHKKCAKVIAEAPNEIEQYRRVKVYQKQLIGGL